MGKKVCLDMLKTRLKNYENFHVQARNGLIVVTAVDRRDNNRYVVAEVLPENFFYW